MIVQRLEQLMEDGPRLTNGIPSANSIKHEARENYPILWEKMSGLQNRQSLTSAKFPGIIDKDLVPKTIGTWKKKPRRRRESRRNKISNKQNNCKTRTLLSRPLQNKKREITNFYVLLARKNFFHLCSKTGTNFSNTLYNWLTLGYLRLFSCSRGSYS